MGVLIRTLTKDDTWEISGVIRNGVFRGDADLAELTATYGYENEEALQRGLDNHYVNAKVVTEAEIEEHWDDSWTGEYTMEDI